MRPQVLRWIAIAIAALAAVDPSLTSTRAARPEISVIAADSVRDAALLALVQREVNEQFTVIPARFAPAAATVIVGNQLPPAMEEVQAPSFAVIPANDAPGVTIEAMNAPDRVALAARVPVATTVHVTGASGRSLETTLRRGDAIVDRVTHRVESGDERRIVTLSFIPTSIGAAPLRVSAQLEGADVSGSNRASQADLVIDVRDERWAVLFHDPRPSWLSTFVRRAVERDPRFVVTSRVVTSRNVSIDAGRPPASLGDAQSLAEFDAIVVGAGQALGEREVAGLETYLRRRGGSVVLLIDERASGPYERLAGVRRWSDATAAAGFGVTRAADDSLGLRATSLIWPTVLPASARALATSPAAAGAAGSERRPIIWRTAVGGGQLVVSGALDAWRFRDAAQSAFDAFWRTTLADAAAAGSTPIEIALPSRSLTPGERVEVTAIVRSLALTDAASSAAAGGVMTATLDDSAASTVTLWPDTAPGRFRGWFRAPRTSGVHRFSVVHDGVRADAAMLVSADPARVRPDDSDLVEAWAASRGGRAFTDRTVGELRPALERALRPSARQETWYPMRSPWWIVPFTLLLGAEWLARRRAGSS